MSIPPAFLDELRARVTLSSVIQRRVKLTRAGREMKGCCPFHNEKTPSFYVNDDKAFYHCFGCGEHGSVIDWVMKQDGLAFRDAIETLAVEAGLEMPLESPEGQERAKAAAGLHEVCARAASWFGEQLSSAGGAAARGYLEKRGLTAAMITAFGLGLAPDARTRLKAALDSVGEAKLVEAGLLVTPDEGETYDRFRGRLMFPIRDPRGRVIAFGGRILGDGQPKYLNSPDTPLFDKGRTLYNFDKAGPAARKSGRLIVAEGYMDVIALAQAGFVEAVAPLGTALTEAQLGLLWRVVPEPVLCFDGDTAGQRAGLRAALRALPLLEPGRSLRLATLPPGQDPDDIVRTQGPAAFEMLLAKAEPLIDRLWRAETEGIDTTTPERRAGVREKLREHSQAIQDGSVRALYDAEFRSRFDALYLPRRGEFTPRTGGGKRGQPFVSPHASEGLKALHARGVGSGEILAVIVGLLEHPGLADRHGEQLATLDAGPPPLTRLLDAILSALTHEPDLDKAALATDLQAHGLSAIAADVRASNRLGFSFTRPTPPDKGSGHVVQVERDFAAVVDTVLARTRIEGELAATTARFAQTASEADWNAQQRLRAERAQVDAALMKLAEDAREAQLDI